MTALTKELGGSRFLAQIGGIIVVFDVKYDEAVRLYKRGQRVKWSKSKGKHVPYRSSHK
jgi:hypothetical protein